MSRIRLPSMIHRLRPRDFAAVAFVTVAAGTALAGGAGMGAGPVPPNPVVVRPMVPAPAAMVAAATSDPSTPAATASPSPGTTPVPPSPPTGLVATRVTYNSATLSWTASTPGCCEITGYDVVIWPSFSDYGRVVSLGNVTTATVTLAPGTQYEITVRATDTERSSGPSNEIVLVTPVASSGDTTPPAAPANLTATGVDGRGAVLSWAPSTDDVAVTGYNVYKFDGWYTSILLYTATQPTCQVPLSGGTNIFYVRARDAAGNVSIASNTVSISGDGPTQGPSPTPASPCSSGTPSSPPPSSTTLSCRVTYRPLAEWPSGFVASLTIANAGQAPINGWTVAFTFGGDQVITTSWGVVPTQEGAAVSLGNMYWNAGIPAGSSLSVGVQGTWSRSNAPPSAFSLNGVACLTG